MRAKGLLGKGLTMSRQNFEKYFRTEKHRQFDTDFFKDAEQRLEGLNDEDRAAILDRLKRAREFLGDVDALERFKSWRAPDER